MPSRKTPRPRSRSSRDLPQTGLRGAHLPQASVVDLDPEELTQNLDEAGDFHVEPLAVDAQSDVEASDDLDEATAEVTLEEATESENRELEANPAQDTTMDARVADAEDVGDLYGVHMTRAMDRELSAPEDQDSFADSDQGENWLEMLEAKSGETGPEPERQIDMTDDSDLDHPAHHSTDTRDRPVADKGSGGPAGL